MKSHAFEVVSSEVEEFDLEVNATRISCMVLYFIGRDRKADIPETRDLNTMLLLNMMHAQGQARLIETTVAEHRRLTEDDQKTED